jgi:hypothetical protein
MPPSAWWVGTAAHQKHHIMVILLNAADVKIRRAARDDGDPYTLAGSADIDPTIPSQPSTSTTSMLSSLSSSTMSSRWCGSTPARAGRRGTVTVIVCSPERMRCICA